jgi:tetratricopeptide (TPR) repeat protein
LVYEGDKEYRRQNLFGAIRYYEKALKLNPKHANAAYNLGNLYSVYEDYQNALDSYNQALKYRPKYVNARIAKGILLSQKFYEFVGAIKEYQQAIDDMPGKMNIFLIYNNYQYVKYNKAVAYYNMGLAYKYLSLLYGENKEANKANLEKSVEAYKNALKYIDDKTNVSKKNKDNETDNFHIEDAYFNLALDYHLLHTLDTKNKYETSRENYRFAKDNYCKCIYISPFDYSAHYNLAILFKQQKNYFDAVLELEKAALIVDSSGNGYRAKYIYDVLNETSQKLHSQPNYEYLREKLDKNPISNYQPTFVNGKIVSSEELDKAMLKNLRSCGTTEKLWDLD